MSENTLPAYLKENEDGSVDITLNRPINISGASVSVLRMREPSVNDQLVMQAIKGGDEAQEIGFIANLCGITVEEVKSLKTRDYARVQKAGIVFKD